MNGFHDAANSVATVVSTRVLTPRVAVLWAAFFNFVAAFVFGVNVASTIGKGTIDPKIVTAWLLLAVLIGATSWDVITWWFGLPTSSSHALVGGLIGAGVVKGGWGVVQTAGVSKIAYFIVLAGTAMGLGTYFGGWRIVRTMGMKITKLHPFGGFSAETAAALTLFATASLGIPVSTTHTIAGAIMGVGSTRRLSAVRWGVARRIVYAWVLTIPAAASIAGVMYYLLSSAGLR